MPGMRGPEVWEHLHEQRPETRVLFVSGFANEAIEASHALGFLAKPFSRAELLGRVRTVLDQRIDQRLA
jgi:FixJ family two-component response regulator